MVWDARTCSRRLTCRSVGRLDVEPVENNPGTRRIGRTCEIHQFLTGHVAGQIIEGHVRELELARTAIKKAGWGQMPRSVRQISRFAGVTAVGLVKVDCIAPVLDFEILHWQRW